MIIRRCSLADKEAQASLMQLYNDTPEEERPALLEEMLERSGRWGLKIKHVLLEQQDIEDAARAKIAQEVDDHIEEILHPDEEVLRGEGAGGDDEENGAGDDAE